jgi:hypothetical protein
MPDKINLTTDQKKLLQMLLYAKEKESQLSILASALDEPMYKEESSYLEERASLYDFVYWETLGKLTGETIDSIFAGKLSEVEAINEVEARALYYSKLTKEQRFDEAERGAEED